jgi:hypothetical protein
MQHHRLMDRIPLSSRTAGLLQTNERFLTIETIGSWHRQFTGLDELVRHEEQVLEELLSQRVHAR